MAFLKKNSILLFFLCWFLLNLLQAGVTELFDDEAYYWVYSKFPAWGYFDHPPMIALLIKAGYFLFHNELGVRFFITILSTATLIIIYQLLPKKNNGLFFSIACSMAVLQIGGIIAVPDIPLMFFTAVFFALYRRFLNKYSIVNALLLGLAMALLLYSKYHGVLIILFTLISNLKLFRQPLAYLSAFFTFLLFFPHLLWQFQHGFPSVQYHLFERNSTGYKFSYTTEYILGQILLAGPLLGWLFLWQSSKYKTADLFERTLKFCLFGIYGFFLLSSLRGRVEANWTIPALIPLFIISHQALLNNDKWKIILWKLAPVTLVLVLMVRLYMALDIAPLEWIPKDEFHQNKIWANAVKEKAGNLPVVFINSYQKASKYWFYSGKEAFSLNTPFYRRNNFNYWPIESSLKGKKVYAVSFEDFAYFPDTVIQKENKITKGKIIDSFYSNSGINLQPVSKMVVVKNQLLSSSFKIISGEPKQLPTPFIVYLYVYHSDQVLGFYKMTASLVSDSWKMRSNEKIKLAAGKYAARFALPSVIPDMPSLNSTFFKLIVE
ncbi:MAG TPA: glycosyltransferase family 39 protein [Chitinophagaceae bacterium]|nr:glycosyltransferase family 39 protein [Chitinophagaceae bacterium]